MNIQQLQDWLLEHADDIHRFTDYETRTSMILLLGAGGTPPEKPC